MTGGAGVAEPSGPAEYRCAESHRSASGTCCDQVLKVCPPLGEMMELTCIGGRTSPRKRRVSRMP